MDMEGPGTGLVFVTDTGTFSLAWLHPHVGLLFGSCWLLLLVLKGTARSRAAPGGSAPSPQSSLGFRPIHCSRQHLLLDP